MCRFAAAQALGDDALFAWTDPYVFFTSKEPGITVSARWRGEDGRRYVIIISHDVKLLDLSRFTSRVVAGKNGMAAIDARQDRIDALPQ